MATTLGAMPVGSTVWFNVGGVKKEFIVVQHNKPAANVYDDAWNGATIVIIKETYGTSVWTSPQGKGYFASTINSYLNSSFVSALDAEIKANLRLVKPHTSYPSIAVFLLSGTEVGYPKGTAQMSIEGACLSYWSSPDARALRIARSNGVATGWWLRSGCSGGTQTQYSFFVNENGDPNGGVVDSTLRMQGVRPAVAINSTIFVLDDGRVTTNQPPATPASITLPTTVKGGATLAISWGGSSDPDGNLAGYKLERSLNGGGYSQIYAGGATSYTDSITYGWGTVAYRVKAYDSLGVESGYTTSPTRAVVNNSAPSAPTSITVPPTVRGGKSCAVSWGAATDVDGNLTGYKLERSVNGGGYAQVYAGAARTFTETITRGWTSLIYRVRAYDAENAHSGYTNAPTRTIVNNLAPVISGADGDLGVKTAAFSQTFSVTDDDGDPITVTEKLDAATLRTYAATAGATNTLNIDADRFMRILNGHRTISSIASDNQGGIATRAWTFTKSVTKLSVTLKSPLPADAVVTKCVLNVVREIPLGADFTVEVCNNAFDVSPTWEDATASVLAGRKYFLQNTTKTAANWGFNLRIAVDRKNTVGDCYIAGIGGAFA